MTVVCSAPDASLGVAFRLSTYLDCQARALGENGFQALAGGAIGTALLSGVVTVFIALIGYRLMLGSTPDARDGVGWAVRLGIVLALVTSWPAFQALVYRVAVDAPVHIAAVLLPASGLAGEGIDERVQQGYDTLRLGITDGQAVTATAQNGQPVAAARPLLGEPRPKTASLLVIATAGLAGALRIAIGFLLAVAPLAIMSLLFNGTNGLFIGWVRALAGLALGLVASTVVTAIHLVAIEGELAHLQASGLAQAGVEIDPQALTTIVLFFALVGVIATLAGIAMGSALRLPRARATVPAPIIVHERVDHQLAPQAASARGQPAADAAAAPAQARAKAVAEVLSTTVHREQRAPAAVAADHRDGQREGPAAVAAAVEHRDEYRPVERIGVAGRRSLGRRTLSAARRDKVA
jgi:type IV secretion system protein VirB6